MEDPYPDVRKSAERINGEAKVTWLVLIIGKLYGPDCIGRMCKTLLKRLESREVSPPIAGITHSTGATM